MNENVPARQAMTFDFNEKSHKGRQGNFCTIASVLSDEYKAACNKSRQDQSMRQWFRLPRRENSGKK